MVGRGSRRVVRGRAGSVEIREGLRPDATCAGSRRPAVKLIMITLWENNAALAEGAVTCEQRFLAAAQAGRNCFLTGMAGTGKSTMLRQFIREAVKRVDVTAPTGVAALNVG